MKTTRFNAADYLSSPSAQAEYIAAASETGDPKFIRDAHNVVARARGMTSASTRSSKPNRPRSEKLRHKDYR